MTERPDRDPVRIALVFPSVLGTYGDGGNATVLAQRLRWRGIAAEIVGVEIDADLPEQADLYVLGGGEDSAQTLAVSRLRDGVLARAADARQAGLRRLRRLPDPRRDASSTAPATPTPGSA